MSGGNQGFSDFGDFGGFGGGHSFKFTSGGYNDFTFDRANDIFKEFFGGSNGFFDDDDDDFFSMPGYGKSKGGANKKSKASKNSGSGMMMHDPFDDDFFGGGFGRGFGGFGGGMADMFADMDRHMSMGSGGFGGGGMTSVSTSTVIRNGKKVTVTKKTTTQPDGTTKTEVTESVDDGKGNRTQNKYIPDGNNKKY